MNSDDDDEFRYIRDDTVSDDNYFLAVDIFVSMCLDIMCNCKMTGRITRAPRVEYDSVCSSLCVCGIFLDRLRLYRETEANVLRCHAQSGTQFCRRPCFGLISLNLMLVYRVCFLRCVQLQFVYVSVCEAEICDFSRTVVTIANVADFCQPAINSPNCSLPLSLSLVP